MDAEFNESHIHFNSLLERITWNAIEGCVHRGHKAIRFPQILLLDHGYTAGGLSGGPLISVHSRSL